MWNKVMYRMFQGCLMVILVGVTSLYGIRLTKCIKEEVNGHGRNPK